MNWHPVLRYRQMRQALLWIGTDCTNYTYGHCRHSPDRSPVADFTADRWCDACIATWGLSDPVTPSTIGRYRP